MALIGGKKALEHGKNGQIRVLFQNKQRPRTICFKIDLSRTKILKHKVLTFAFIGHDECSLSLKTLD